jgi:hypothetical protein
VEGVDDVGGQAEFGEGDVDLRGGGRIAGESTHGNFFRFLLHDGAAAGAEIPISAHQSDRLAKRSNYRALR